MHRVLLSRRLSWRGRERGESELEERKRERERERESRYVTHLAHVM